MSELNVRPAIEADIPAIYGFIRKMAAYEKLEHEVDTDEPSLRRALFSERQAEAVIGEVDGKPVGFALFFHNFSTFKGQRGLYLEDLFVDEEHRGKGYGKELLLYLVRLAKQRDCRRMEWMALDWNTPALRFYESLGATALKEWCLFRLDEEGIERLANL